MMIPDLKRNLELLKQSIQYFKQKGVMPSKSTSRNYANFDKQQEAYYQKNYLTSLHALQYMSSRFDKYNENHILLERQLQKLCYADLQTNLQVIANILDILEGMPAEENIGIPSTKKQRNSSVIFQIPKNVPEEIRAELTADLKELQQCFQNDCLRSSIILCGRMLETALHRKYFDITQFDILEKNPGIGLGTLIAKLKEKGCELDPGLTQQIHLINQVRIFSVHKKQEAFTPSNPQTQAIILYTMDTLQKLF